MSAHQLYVKSLYRKSLKLASDWYWQRAEFREKAVMIRGLFEQNRHLTNQKEIQQHLLRTEGLLAKYYHPQPYIAPSGLGGTKWERNIPVPEEMIRRGVTPLDNYS
ncbi:hypothetical protein EDD86DRAFT_226263 [Gorgonomyces haynaldii]|nr:hypothetical protein EDD86DRAFT_226263 [Gorgonomyces haynaldii]